MTVRKKIFLGIGSILLIVIGYIGYVLFTTRSHSPAATETFENNGLSLKIEYCRPYKKERLIFGTVEEGALQPDGKYWRLGANEATKLTTETAINFGGQALEAGSYSIYAFPAADHWVLGINSKADRWGATPPDFSQDVGRIKLPIIKTANSLEQFTINIEQVGSEAVVEMQWDQTQVRIPVSPSN